MKKNIIKILLIISVLVIIVVGFTTNVKATQTSLYTPEESSKVTVKEFLSYLSAENYYALIYIDSNNYELYNTVQDKLHSYEEIKYEIKKVKKQGDNYKVEVKIAAEGINWKVSGITANFDVKEINNSYKITSTDFFEITSPEHIAGMAFGIVSVVFIILGVVFGTIIIIVVIVIVVAVNKSKKKK